LQSQDHFISTKEKLTPNLWQKEEVQTHFLIKPREASQIQGHAAHSLTTIRKQSNSMKSFPQK
jgi:hypothetical protein